MKPTIEDLQKYLYDKDGSMTFSDADGVFIEFCGFDHDISWQELEDMVVDHIERRQDVIGQNGNTDEHYKIGLTE